MARNRWDRHSLRRCSLEAQMSKDPSTQVGAVIIGIDDEVLSTGFNGLPRGVPDSTFDFSNRERKLMGIIHAERNAICNAARNGVRLKGSTLFVLQRDVKTGECWGAEPCAQCCGEIIQSGIEEIVSLAPRDNSFPERWAEDRKLAQWMLTYADVHYRECSITEIGDLNA